MAMLQIILQTAKYVRQSGGQTEFVLRVKQAYNPNFEFLDPKSLQHAYFRWLVATKPEVRPQALLSPCRSLLSAQQKAHTAFPFVSKTLWQNNGKVECSCEHGP